MNWLFPSETDLNKASQVVEQTSEENERVCQVNSDVEDEAETEQQAKNSNLKSESQNATPVSRSPQENGRPFQGARPKVKQQVQSALFMEWRL